MIADDINSDAVYDGCVCVLPHAQSALENPISIIQEGKRRMKKEEDGDRKTDIQKIKVLVFMIFTRF